MLGKSTDKVDTALDTDICHIRKAVACPHDFKTVCADAKCPNGQLP